MAEDQALNEILGVDVSQEDNSTFFEDTSFMNQQSRQKYTVDTVEAPKDYIEKLNKLLEAADIAGSIVKSGKINYYTAESLFNIYPFISEAAVSRTTKNMSTINYDSIKKTMLSNLKTYTESLIDELDEKWDSYYDVYYEIVSDNGVIERALNSLHAFSIENKDVLEELVTFSYARKFKVAKNNMQGEEVFFKFSELNESNIKEYESTLSQDIYFNYIITNYSYYESNQLTFNDLFNKLNWINESINVCFDLYSEIAVAHSSNPLVAVMTVFHKLSNLTNSDLDKLITFIRNHNFKRHDELSVKHTTAKQELRSFADDADNFAKLIDDKNYFFEYLNKLTKATNYLGDIKFIYTYAVKNKQLLDDLKSTLKGFRETLN